MRRGQSLSNEFTRRASASVVRSCDVDRRSRNVNTAAGRQQQQQHLRSSSDNVSFSLNDVGVTRAAPSHLHVFCRAAGRCGRAWRRRPESDTLPLPARPSAPPPRRGEARRRPVASAHRPTGGSIRTVLGVGRRGRRCVFRVGGSHVRRRRAPAQMWLPR